MTDETEQKILSCANCGADINTEEETDFLVVDATGEEVPLCISCRFDECEFPETDEEQEEPTDEVKDEKDHTTDAGA